MDWQKHPLYCHSFTNRIFVRKTIPSHLLKLKIKNVYGLALSCETTCIPKDIINLYLFDPSISSLNQFKIQLENLTAKELIRHPVYSKDSTTVLYLKYFRNASFKMKMTPNCIFTSTHIETF